MVDLVSDEVTMAQTFTREERNQSNVSVGFLKPLAKHWVVLTVFRLLKLKKNPGGNSDVFGACRGRNFDVILKSCKSTTLKLF